MPTYLRDDQRAAFEAQVRCLDAAIDRFCARRGYVRTQQDLGTYPGRIMRKRGDFERVIESILWKSPNGEVFEEFFPDVPFSFTWVACLQRGSVQYRIDHFNIIPFDVLKENIASYLDAADDAMSALDAEAVVRQGKAIDLAAPFQLEDYVL